MQRRVTKSYAIIYIIKQERDDVIKWKHFPRYWTFVRGIHRSPVNSPHKGQWRGALMFSLICAWINGWVNNGEACDLRCYLAQYDVPVMARETPVVFTYWGRCHIQTPPIRVIVGSGSGLSIRHQSINWTNGDISWQDNNRTNMFY